MKERLLTSKDTSGPGKPWRCFDRPQDRYPKFGYPGYDPECQDGEHPNGEERPEDGYGYEGYPATAPGGEPDDEWIDDEDLAVQLNAYTAVAFEAELDDLDDTYAESVRSYAQTAFVQATGKTKGKGKPGGKPGGTVVRSLQQPHHSGQKGQASRIEGDGPMSEMWHHWPLGR